MAGLNPLLRDRGRPRYGRGLILLVCGLYFVVPIAFTILFTVDDPVHGFTLHAYQQIFKVEGLWPALQLSLELAAATIAVAVAAQRSAAARAGGAAGPVGGARPSCGDAASAAGFHAGSATASDA